MENFFAATNCLSTGEVYVNGLEDEGMERARASYGRKYERLRELKRKFEPDNFFRLNQNIEPAPDEPNSGQAAGPDRPQNRCQIDKRD